MCVSEVKMLFLKLYFKFCCIAFFAVKMKKPGILSISISRLKKSVKFKNKMELLFH